MKEYLPLLQERQKWFTRKQNLQPNHLVLMVDEKTSRKQWPIAIIEETYPSMEMFDKCWFSLVNPK